MFGPAGETPEDANFAGRETDELLPQSEIRLIDLVEFTEFMHVVLLLIGLRRLAIGLPQAIEAVYQRVRARESQWFVCMRVLHIPKDVSNFGDVVRSLIGP